MKLVTSIPSVCLKNKREGALVARAFLQAVVKANECWLLHNPKAPKLYDSGVTYAREPWAGKYEEFATIPMVLKRGWGDCDDLCAWRVAEIRREGRPADILIYWRPKTHIWHVEVRHWPSAAARKAGEHGTVEDPSRLLNMSTAD